MGRIRILTRIVWFFVIQGINGAAWDLNNVGVYNISGQNYDIQDSFYRLVSHGVLLDGKTIALDGGMAKYHVPKDYDDGPDDDDDSPYWDIPDLHGARVTLDPTRNSKVSEKDPMRLKRESGNGSDCRVIVEGSIILGTLGGVTFAFFASICGFIYFRSKQKNKGAVEASHDAEVFVEADGNVKVELDVNDSYSLSTVSALGPPPSPVHHHS